MFHAIRHVLFVLGTSSLKERSDKRSNRALALARIRVLTIRWAEIRFKGWEFVRAARNRSRFSDRSNSRDYKKVRRRRAEPCTVHDSGRRAHTSRIHYLHQVAALPTLHRREFRKT